MGCDKDSEIAPELQTEHFSTVSKKEALLFIAESKTKDNSQQRQEIFIDTIYSDNLTLENITNTEAQLTVVPVATQYKNLYSRLLLLKVNDSLQSVVLHMNTSLIYDTENFSGQILLSDLEGHYKKGFRVYNGDITHVYEETGNNVSLAQGRDDGAECRSLCGHEKSDSYCMCNMNNLSEVVITAPKNTDLNYLRLEDLYGSGGGSNMCEVACNTWGYGGGLSGPTTGLLEDRIINDLTDPCAKSIFTQLQNEMINKDLLQKIMYPNQNITLTFSDAILKLFNDSDIFHLSIQNNSLGEGKNASTSGGKITISDSYLKNATQLSIARTMIHEIVHAYLNLRYGNALTFEDGIDFKNKMEEYAIDNGITDINSNKFHHEFMGQYVDAIAMSLLTWDIEYGTGGNLGWDYYRSMAFAGLVNVKKGVNGNFLLDNNGNPIYEDTNSFKELVPNENDRDNIKK
ncbi:hypothetical protein [Formosa haliotis]|uniref:hypothetical protein n=1 Tax=Formosa haliotis TaxID=1555194 RepID=UPI001146BA01|nr:hypothetical protein [Formosa haliotis]